MLRRLFAQRLFIFTTMLFFLLEKFFVELKHWLVEIDKHLFLQINTQYTNSFFDNILPTYREISFWYPLYAAILFFVFYKYKLKAVYWIIALALTVTLSDTISSRIMKDFFERLRPCQDPMMQLQHARLLLGRCPTSFSFTSSHATNHFAAATFLFFTLKPVLKKWSYAWFVWAATIGYAQIYVGVHYPIDVLVGGIIGLLIGWSMKELYFKYFKLY